MKYNRLGRTDIRVSRISLGTMTFGEQNDETESFRILDMAVDAGVNLLDTAEMYSAPTRPETQGLSEVIIGRWMRARRNRDRVLVATKITGPDPRFHYIRGGDLRFTRRHIRDAVEGSLKRLATDTIDLYQLHWPERSANFFGQLGYEHVEGEQWTPLEEALEGLDRVMRDGLVRVVGVSNETPWGLMRLLALADRDGLPRVAGIQNPYSLVCRTFEVGLSEVAIREDCGLLAYSPLAFGLLTGKYRGGALPAGSRLRLYPEYDRYIKPNGIRAADAYVALAEEHGLDPAQMALAYVGSRRFLTSTIIGVTTPEQLQADLGAEELRLGDDVLTAIEAIHADNPNPTP